MSFTRPRSSSMLSMLGCAPDLIFPACSSHLDSRTAGSGSSAAHFTSVRSPRADECCLRMHRWQMNCGRRGRRLKEDIASQLHYFEQQARSKSFAVPRPTAALIGCSSKLQCTCLDTPPHTSPAPSGVFVIYLWVKPVVDQFQIINLCCSAIHY